MNEDDAKEHGATLTAHPPFSFGLGLQGELIIGFVGGYMPPDNTPIRMFLTVPAEELPALQRGLNESKGIRDTLSAKEPKQGPH